MSIAWHGGREQPPRTAGSTLRLPGLPAVRSQRAEFGRRLRGTTTGHDGFAPPRPRRATEENRGRGRSSTLASLASWLLLFRQSSRQNSWQNSRQSSRQNSRQRFWKLHSHTPTLPHPHTEDRQECLSYLLSRAPAPPARGGARGGAFFRLDCARAGMICYACRQACPAPR